MTEEQKQMTMGQVADMKRNLEENIKNQLIEFMDQTGINSLQIDGWVEVRKQITDDFTVETKRETNLRVNVINFLNN